MWMLDNQTPFAADRGWVRDKNGAEVWIVAVKGSFLIAPDGSLSLAATQEKVLHAPKYRGAPGKSALLYPEDLVHLKPTSDILLHGHAYAPQGQPSPQMDVLMKVGPVSKVVRVFGDRFWRVGLIGLKISDPEPFVRMPLTTERAFGGRDENFPEEKDFKWDPRNPLGTGFGTDAAHVAGHRLPNIESLRELISSWKDRPAPACFGPIARDWMPRVRYAGTYGQKWEKERQPLLPEDFDERFFQCAPEDQRPPHHLKGGETVELVNLSSTGVLRFALPRVTLSFRTIFTDGEETHRAVIHTVIIEPDVPRVIVVWHTHLPCHPRVLKLRTTIIRRKLRLKSVDGGTVEDFQAAAEPEGGSA